MSDAARYRIRGALGASPTSPLLAEKVVGDEVHGPVVLDRPTDATVLARLRSLGGSRFVVPCRIVETARGAFAEVPLVRGRDLDQVREQSQGPLSSEVVSAILREVVRALLQAESAEVHHGALTPSAVRIDVDGRVRLLGARGGRAEQDVRAVHDLVVALAEADDGHLDPRFDADAWPSDLRGLLAHLDGPDVDLVPLAAGEGFELHAHALAGTVLPEVTPGSVTPPRVQIAAVGAITLALGLGAGWALFGWGQGVDAPIAVEEVGVRCDVEGDLDGSLTGRYLCVREPGGLRCTER